MHELDLVERIGNLDTYQVHTGLCKDCGIIGHIEKSGNSSFYALNFLPLEGHRVIWVDCPEENEKPQIEEIAEPLLEKYGIPKGLDILWENYTPEEITSTLYGVWYDRAANEAQAMKLYDGDCLSSRRDNSYGHSELAIIVAGEETAKHMVQYKEEYG